MELGIKVNARDKEKTKYHIRKKLKLAESFQKKQHLFETTSENRVSIRKQKFFESQLDGY